MQPVYYNRFRYYDPNCARFVNQLIVEEYLLSDGADSPENIEMALNGFGTVEDYVSDSSVVAFFKNQLLKD